jgi:PiT family inorganic phosphate transporter
LQIAASWVVSPVVGGIIAAAFLAFIKTAIIYRDDKIAAARHWVPLLVAVMAGAFAAYLAMKGLKEIVTLDAEKIAFVGLGAFAATWLPAHLLVRHQSEGMENRNQSLRKLFSLPLVISAALLSFAHGANDVANAVGPLAAIVFTAQASAVTAEVTIPLWVMLIGALGISVGLLLFGPRLIRMVGEQITRLNPMRAFCVALSAAITVIVASALGLPISSTHTAVGAVFGVGFFREWYTARSKRRRAYLERKGIRLKAERNGEPEPILSRVWFNDEEARKGEKSVSREEIARRKLVRRAHVTTIVAAWVTTVPAAALLSAGVFLLLDLLF